MEDKFTNPDEQNIMIFTNPLDKIFSQQSKIKLLRFLVQHRGEFTGREIAKSVGLAHPTVHSALSHLREQGIIFMRKSGNALLYSLNRRHQATKDIIIPVFKKERPRLSLKVLNSWSNLATKFLLSL